MGIVKIVVTVIYIVVCLALIVLTMMQNKDSRGASDTITGSSTRIWRMQGLIIQRRNEVFIQWRFMS